VLAKPRHKKVSRSSVENVFVNHILLSGKCLISLFTEHGYLSKHTEEKEKSQLRDTVCPQQHSIGWRSCMISSSSIYFRDISDRVHTDKSMSHSSDSTLIVRLVYGMGLTSNFFL
jgi:hypothetical protein